MSTVIDIIAALFMLAGSILAVSGAVGLVRFRDTLSRLHAVSKPQTLGLVLTVTGAILHVLVSENLSQAAKGDIGMMLLIIPDHLAGGCAASRAAGKARTTF